MNENKLKSLLHKVYKNYGLQFLFFSITLLSFLVWFFAQYPGLYIYDTFAMIEDVQNSKINAWGSYIYATLIYFILPLSSNLYLLGLAQSLLFSFVVTYCFSITLKHKLNVFVPVFFLILLLVSPINGAYSVYYNRDPLFSWVFILALFLIFNLIVNKKYSTDKIPNYPLFLSLVLGLLPALRIDSLILLIFTPLILIYFKVWKGRLLIKNCFLIFITTILFNLVIPHLLSVTTIKSDYVLTAIINPLSSILKNGEKSKIDNLLLTEQVHIEKIFKVTDLLENQNNFEIPIFHKGLYIHDYSKSEFNEFIYSYFKIVINNPILFLKNRWNLFIHMTGIAGNEIKWIDELEYKPNDDSFQTKIINNLDLKKESFLPKVKNVQNLYSYYLLQNHYGIGFKLMFMSSILGFIFMIIGLLGFYIRPIFASICLLLFLRTFVVFLTAPAPQFKYIYSLYLFGFLAPLLLFVENKVVTNRSNLPQIKS